MIRLEYNLQQGAQQLVETVDQIQRAVVDVYHRVFAEMLFEELPVFFVNLQIGEQLIIFCGRFVRVFVAFIVDVDLQESSDHVEIDGLAETTRRRD